MLVNPSPVDLSFTVFTLGGSAALFAAGYYLYRTEPGAAYARAWMLAWGIHALRLLFEALYRETKAIPFQLLFHALVLANGALVLEGSRLLIGSPRSAKRLALVLVLAGGSLAFCAVAPERTWADTVTFFSAGVYYLWSGVLLIRRAQNRPPARLAGWAFIAWSVHKLDYAPLNAFLPALVPYGYLLSCALSLLIAGSLIVLPLDALKERQIRSLRDVVVILAAAIEARDAYTESHSRDVACTASAVAGELGLSPEDQEQIYMAGLLHDIGKIGISDAVLTKSLALTPEEVEQIKRHPVIGSEILEKGGPVFAPLIPAVRHHNERWDGTGYPDGLQGEAIPLWARILAVADAYHAIISDRPYRPARSPAEAVAEITRCAGTQFCPLVVTAFLRHVNRPRGR